MKVTYSSNNSGGSWWLKDEDWKALEAFGWEVEWFANQEHKFFKPTPDGRWLGALASKAIRHGLTLGQAIKEFEQITGQDSTDLGCACCGAPHSFAAYDDNDKQVGYYTPDCPDRGTPYSGE